MNPIREHSRPSRPRLVPAAAAVLALALLLAPSPAAAHGDHPPMQESAMEATPREVVTLPGPDSPLVAIRLMFTAGSIHDPEGKEGLAAVTARMVGQAATEKRSYAEMLDALYPMAANVAVRADREVTVLGGVVHRDTLETYADLLLETVLAPAFRESDLARHKGDLEAFLTTTLRSGNDELLGLETIQQEIFAGHPYGHAPEGTVEGLESITLDDVKRFYRRHYVPANLLLGVAGGYPEGFPERLAKKLATGLPPSEEGVVVAEAGAGPAATPSPVGALLELPAPPKVEGRRFTLVEKQTGSVGIHFGYPLPLNRGDDEYYPLMVANSFLGEHRTSHGRLMSQMRGLRGLNYGDYSYIEYWHLPPWTNAPTPGVPRRQQFFSVWIRPVRPETAHFALRNALYEVERLRERGMTREEFETTRDYLTSYSKLWAQSLEDRLGFHLDSRFYGMPYYIDHIEEQLAGLTLEEVNAAVRKHLRTDRYQAVFITDEAAAVKAYLEADQPSPMTYGSDVPAEVLETDKVIQAIPVKPTEIEIVPVEEMFSGGEGAE